MSRATFVSGRFAYLSPLSCLNLTISHTTIGVGPHSPGFNANKTGFEGYCCSFEVHPTASGYLRMASVFALSISENQKEFHMENGA